MNALGISLIVAGMSFLVSGLIFLLPAERRLSKQVEAIEESQKEIEDRLEQFRRKRDEL
jgi:Na+-transporting methylmalonyl-CoA/oxaloacetate decarboxylase gamma subunit